MHSQRYYCIYCFLVIKFIFVLDRDWLLGDHHCLYFYKHSLCCMLLNDSLSMTKQNHMIPFEFRVKSTLFPLQHHLVFWGLIQLQQLTPVTHCKADSSVTLDLATCSCQVCFMAMLLATCWQCQQLALPVLLGVIASYAKVPELISAAGLTPSYSTHFLKPPSTFTNSAPSWPCQFLIMYQVSACTPPPHHLRGVFCDTEDKLSHWVLLECLHVSFRTLCTVELFNYQQ